MQTAHGLWNKTTGVVRYLTYLVLPINVQVNVYEDWVRDGKRPEKFRAKNPSLLRNIWRPPTAGPRLPGLVFTSLFCFVLFCCVHDSLSCDVREGDVTARGMFAPPAGIARSASPNAGLPPEV